METKERRILEILLILLNFAFIVSSEDVVADSKSKPCTYFGGIRMSSPQSSLVNCSWYSDNSCCKRTEVTSVFGGMYPLYQASRQCANRMNYLMCYFCSPDQYLWYEKQARVCTNFCDTLYENCVAAIYKGTKIGEAYKSGRDFCEGQKFQVEDSNVGCFKFDPTVFSTASVVERGMCTVFCFVNLLMTLYKLLNS